MPWVPARRHWSGVTVFWAQLTSCGMDSSLDSSRRGRLSVAAYVPMHWRRADASFVLFWALFLHFERGPNRSGLSGGVIIGRGDASRAGGALWGGGCGDGGAFRGSCCSGGGGDWVVIAGGVGFAFCTISDAAVISSSSSQERMAAAARREQSFVLSCFASCLAIAAVRRSSSVMARWVCTGVSLCLVWVPATSVVGGRLPGICSQARSWLRSRRLMWWAEGCGGGRSHFVGKRGASTEAGGAAGVSFFCSCVGGGFWFVGC